MLKTVTVDEVEERRAGDLLRQLVRDGDTMTVVLEGGETVVLHPVGPLRRLPTLSGHVPEGWKDAIYGP